MIIQSKAQRKIVRKARPRKLLKRVDQLRKINKITVATPRNRKLQSSIIMTSTSKQLCEKGLQDKDFLGFQRTYELAKK